MRNDGLINVTELRKAILQIKPDNQLFEVRIIGDGKKPMSGYFTNVETLIKAFDTVDLRNANVYISVNEINEALYSRQQADRFLAVKTTTSDKEITYYNWLFIDLDPVRPTGISSTDDELKSAAELAQKVYVYLKGLGFAEPIKAFSGNGYHLLYAIQLINNAENSQLIERCLKVLSDMFSNEQVKVDTTNYNPARICKLYGTMAQKGSHTSSRPHRMSRLDGDVREIEYTKRVYLEKLVEELEEEPKPERYNNYAPMEFDLESFLALNGHTYKTQPGTDCTIYRLDNCPFDSNHTDGDSKIFHYNNGAIAFKCHHDSCSKYHWQDVRLKYDPEAYTDRDAERDNTIEKNWKKHNRDKAQEELIASTAQKWETVAEVIEKPTPDNEYVKTGIKIIDRRMHGLMKGGVSVWSGLRASAKSTILSQIALNAVNDDHTVLFYSGELTDKRFTKWLLQQAAGREYTEVRPLDESTYRIVPMKIQKDISKWISNRFYLYNNACGSNYNDLIEALENKIIETKPDLIILDNLMTVDLMEVNINEYSAQTILMKRLHVLAEIYNCHIALVAHPRKTVSFLRLVDISGSGNIANLVDSAFIVHRMNHDFKVGYKTEFMDKKAEEDDVVIHFSGATNVVEIAKDREEGIQDLFIPLWYEVESRRLKNEQTEVIKYKWTTEWAETEAIDSFIVNDYPF